MLTGTRVRHCIWALLLLLLPAGRATAQVAPAPAARSYTVFLRGTPIGREEVTVRSDASGTTISSQSQLGAPLHVVLRGAEVKYGPDWALQSLTIDSVLGTQAVRIRTQVANGQAVTEGSDSRRSLNATTTIAPRTVALPDIFFGAFEALGRQFATINGTPDDMRAFVPPAVDALVHVRSTSNGRIQDGASSFDIYRYEIQFSNGGQELLVNLTTDRTGALVSINVPAQALDVVRTDVATATTRTSTFANPTDESVTIPAAGFNLAGTLTKPRQAAAGPAPAVVLLGGSGVDDRDGYAAGIPVLGQIAGALADAGYLTVRYDKRGTGQSGGRAESVTLSDYAEDARVVVKWLADRRDVDQKRIVVIGHSEGAWVGLLAASRDRRIAAVVSLAAPSKSGAEVVLEQQEMELTRLNLSPGERAEKIALQKRIQAAVLSGTGWEGVPAEMRRQADTPIFQSLLAFDPLDVVSKVRQPMLFVHGALDRQVPVSHLDTLAGTARTKSKSKVVEAVSVRGTNHLLVPATTGEVSEYGSLTDRMVSRDVTSAISGWLGKTLPAGR